MLYRLSEFYPKWDSNKVRDGGFYYRALHVTDVVVTFHITCIYCIYIRGIKEVRELVSFPKCFCCKIMVYILVTK